MKGKLIIYYKLDEGNMIYYFFQCFLNMINFHSFYWKVINFSIAIHNAKSIYLHAFGKKLLQSCCLAENYLKLWIKWSMILFISTHIFSKSPLDCHPPPLQIFLTFSYTCSGNILLKNSNKVSMYDCTNIFLKVFAF